MKVVFLCTDLATLDNPLPWPNLTRLVATSVTDGVKLVEEAAPDMVLLQLDSSGVSPAEALQKLRSLTDAPLLILDRQKKGLQTFKPAGQGKDGTVFLPPLPRRRHRPRYADLLGKDSSLI